MQQPHSGYPKEADIYISDPAHIVRDSFTIGKEAQEAPGYYVGEGCIGCKLCYSACPQKCIDITKKPVGIDQHRCLHCFFIFG